MQHHVLAEAEQADQGLLRDDAGGELDGLLHRLQAGLLQTQVDAEEEDDGSGGGLSWLLGHLEGVVQGVVLRHQLRRRLLLAYPHVGGREGVGAETEGARPAFVPVVGLAVRIEDGLALSAVHRVVVDWWEVRALFQRCEEAAERDNCLGGFCARAGPMVPRKTNSISPLI